MAAGKWIVYELYTPGLAKEVVKAIKNNFHGSYAQIHERYSYMVVTDLRPRDMALIMKWPYESLENVHGLVD